MTYFSTRDIASIALFAGLWGVLNSIFSPIVFRMFGLPILCDMIGFAILALTAWWIRRFGAVTAVGLIATIINFLFNPAGVHFLGFTVACTVFDVITKLIGYDRCFKKPLFTAVSMLSISVLSAAVAGTIIGIFFMAAPALDRWGGVLGWAGLHAIGGVIGGFIGTVLVTGLAARGLRGTQATGDIRVLTKFRKV